MIERDTFPFGIEHNGGRHTSFEVREQRFRDSFELLQKNPDLDKASDAEFGLHLLAGRVTIDGIPREEVTAELILDLCTEDYGCLQEAVQRLEARRVAFRDAAGAAPQAGNRPS